MLSDWRRPVGFRLAPWDIPVLAAGGVGAASIGSFAPEPLQVLAWLLATVVGHFFLFCNVFRLRTRIELTWAVIFLCNVVGWTLAGELSGPAVLLTQLPVTLLLIGLELRAPSYHGIGAERINPALRPDRHSGRF